MTDHSNKLKNQFINTRAHTGRTVELQFGEINPTVGQFINLEIVCVVVVVLKQYSENRLLENVFASPQLYSNINYRP